MTGARMAWTRVIGVAACAALAWPAVPVAAEPSPPFIAVDADWLTTVNYFREMSGLAPVGADGTTSAGAALHSCYMLLNDITHEEVPGKPGFTVEGQKAGRNGNVAVSTAMDTPARRHIELWMTGPFHALGILRKDLATVGYGECNRADTPKWHSGATLDVLTGLGARTPQTAPILFPGDGSTTSLDRFITESPNPLDFCGWTGSAGLPVIAMMPEVVAGPVTTSMSGPGGPVQTCTLSALNTTGSAQAILKYDNAVVAVPRTHLQPGTYTVTASTAARTVTWSFTVDPAAAQGVQPVPTAAPVGAPGGFEPVDPARVVDTRDAFGATRLDGGVAKRIQITGRGGVPAGATALTANFTVVDPAGAGYLTVWNCSGNQPVVSTVNFTAGQVTPNAATVPLDASGGLCVFSNVGTHLVVDVNGFYRPSGPAKFTPVEPYRIADTREGHGSGRLAQGDTLVLKVAGQGQVPAGASAVALNVTSTGALRSGFVTAHACDDGRPTVSNLNPQPNRVRPNLTVVPVAADGTVCLFTSQDVDLVVDVTGYYSTTSTQAYTPSTPFRFVDTRDRHRTEMNIGTQGARVGGGTVLQFKVAGVRGVPANAKAVSVNLTVTGPSGRGYATAFPCGAVPLASTANFEVGESVSNAAQLRLSADGRLCVFSPWDTHVVIDVTGWWT